MVKLKMRPLHCPAGSPGHPPQGCTPVHEQHMAELNLRACDHNAYHDRLSLGITGHLKKIFICNDMHRRLQRHPPNPTVFSACLGRLYMT
uniref:Uncharacterized protein n=1 Tax=Setaria italica TaxID=4555 RepID=K4A3L2_SETIT